MVNPSTENADNNALATIVGSLGSLTESELRQLYLIVGVRLGFPAGTEPGTFVPGSSKQGSAGVKNPRTAGPSGGKTAKMGKASSKGNPQRKSQWANHPLYQEYSRLKKVVEAQAKEMKISFNQVDTAESRAYQQAFTQWVSAKGSFRDRKARTNEEASEPEAESEKEDEESTTPRPGSGKTAPASEAPAGGTPAADPHPSKKGKGKAVP